MPTIWKCFLAAFVLTLSGVPAANAEPYVLWDPEKPLPKAAEIPLLENVEFVVVKPRQPEVDGYNWLHGAALGWHQGKLYASFGLNRGPENVAGEEAGGRVSTDGGKTWGYSNCGGRGANRNSAEMAILPVEQLRAK